MKIKLTFLFVLFSFISLAQVGIGYNLDKIKEEDSLGVIKLSSDGYVYYTECEHTSSTILYFLNYNYFCYASAVKPNNKEIKKTWIKSLNNNKDWIKLKRKKWIMILSDSYSIECKQTKDDNNNTLFLFTLN